jgi:hypothetical protein
MTDETLRERLVVAARAAVERTHSRDASGAELAGMYRSLVRSKVAA